MALSLPGAAAAGPIDAGALATPGACAEPGVALVVRPAEDDEGAAEPTRPDPRTREGARTAAGALRHRFQPVPVAAGLPGAGLEPPAPPELPRPGPCDEPGSGCLGPVQPAPAASPPARTPPPAPPPPPLDFGTGPAEPPGFDTGPAEPPAGAGRSGTP